MMTLHPLRRREAGFYCLGGCIFAPAPCPELFHSSRLRPGIDPNNMGFVYRSLNNRDPMPVTQGRERATDGVDGETRHHSNTVEGLRDH